MTFGKICKVRERGKDKDKGESKCKSPRVSKGDIGTGITRLWLLVITYQLFRSDLSRKAAKTQRVDRRIRNDNYSKNTEHGTQTHRTQNTEHRTQNTEHRTQNLRSSIIICSVPLSHSERRKDEG
jgi:hypothetical protein